MGRRSLIICPHCGGTNLKIVGTYNDEYGVYRQRQCKDCTEFVYTSEKLCDRNHYLFLRSEYDLDNKKHNKNITKTG